MSGLGLPQVLTPLSVGRELSAYLARSRPGSASATPFPSPGMGSGLSVLMPGPYLGAPNANAGQAQGSGRAMDTEGAGQAPEASAAMTGASSTTTNQGPLRQDPTPHLSKSEVSWLADRGAALGQGTKTANLRRGVRLPNDSLWGRVWMGEIQRSLHAQCLVSCTRLCLSEHSRTDGGTKEDGPETWN